MNGDVLATCPHCNGFVHEGDPTRRIDGYIYHLHCGLKPNRRVPLPQEAKDSIARRVDVLTERR